MRGQGHVVEIDTGKGQGHQVGVDIQGQGAETEGGEGQGHMIHTQGHTEGQGHTLQIEKEEKTDHRRKGKTHAQIYQDLLI